MSGLHGLLKVGIRQDIRNIHSIVCCICRNQAY